MANKFIRILPVESLIAENKSTGLGFKKLAQFATEWSTGLHYYSNNDGTCYVDGIGKCEATDIVIPAYNENNGEKVVRIIPRVFQEKPVTSVSIPATVTTIGEPLCYNCTGLTSITVDSKNSNYTSKDGNLYTKNVTKLIQYATGKGSESFSLPSTVTEIGAGAFAFCSNLKGISNIDGVTTIGKGAFMNSGLTTITLPDSLTSIGINLFMNCTSLQSVQLPNIKGIPEQTFSFCSKLTSIIIPDSVTSIGNSAFHGCSSLTSVTIPKGVTSIGRLAFYKCTNLTTINYYGTEEEWEKIQKASDWDDDITNYTVVYNYKNLKYQSQEGGTCWVVGIGGYEGTDIVVPSKSPNDEKVVRIGNEAFSGNTKITSVYIPTSVQSIGDNAFYGCTELSEVNLGGGASGLKKIGASAFKGCSKITKMIIPVSVEYFGASAFEGCTTLQEIDLNNCYNLIYISSKLFKGCTALTTIKYEGSSIQNISDYAFEGCSSLETIEFSSTITYIGNYSFRNCEKLTSITIPKNIGIIGKQVFAKCTNLENITFESDGNLSQISMEALLGCSKLATVTIPKNIKTIGKDAFKDCNKLTRVYYTSDQADWEKIEIRDGNSILEGKIVYCYDVVSNGLEFISYNDGTCYVNRIGTCSDENIVIPSFSPDGDRVVGISNGAFRDNATITSVIIPFVLSNIGANAFHSCSNLQTIKLSSSKTDVTTTIGTSAFRGCGRLETVELSNRLTEINSMLFYECALLTSITIPENVVYIRQGAFAYSGLEEMTIPISVKTIEGGICTGCNNFTTIYYAGTKDEWNEINIYTGNSIFNNAEVRYQQT